MCNANNSDGLILIFITWKQSNHFVRLITKHKQEYKSRHRCGAVFARCRSERSKREESTVSEKFTDAKASSSHKEEPSQAWRNGACLLFRRGYNGISHTVGEGQQQSLCFIPHPQQHSINFQSTTAHSCLQQPIFIFDF